MKKIVCEKLRNEDELTIEQISQSFNILSETTKILFLRGINTSEKVNHFLNPGKEYFHDPFLMTNMDKVVDRIKSAIENNENILIYGDYDVDGISATTILYLTLKKFDLNVMTYIPERVDGYGLKIKTLESLAENNEIDLLITVDCGISAYEEVNFLLDIGIDVIVTDHHEIPEILPQCLIINPKLDSNYPFQYLCGASVALKLSYALIGEEANAFLDFAALATVADSMPLFDENRDIVFEGLKIFNSTDVRACFKELLAGSKDQKTTSTSFSYVIAPKINAAGRMLNASDSLKLFLCSDILEIKTLSKKLNEYNIVRQKECEDMYNTSKEKLHIKGAYKRIITLFDKSWQAGFAGIVAAKLTEEYFRPSIIFVESENGKLKGSARSIDEVNIYNAIEYAKEFTIEFGGHSQACGVTVEKESLELFEDKVDEYLTYNYGKEIFIPKVVCEAKISEKFSMRFAEELEMLEPYGVGNRKPLFYIETELLNAKLLKENSPHISFNTKVLDFIYFNGSKNLEILNNIAKKQIVFMPNLSTFNNKVSLKGFVKDLVLNLNLETDESLYAFRNNLLQLLKKQTKNYKLCSYEQIKLIAEEELKTTYGSAFLVSDITNLKKYKGLESLDIHLFFPLCNNLLNLVVLSPNQEADLKEYKRIVYLDKPLKIFDFGNKNEVFVCEEVSGYSFINELKIDRDFLISIFLIIKKNNGTSVKNSIEAYNKFGQDFDAYNFIFAFEVFAELSIIKITNDRLEITTVKNDLENSIIYNELKKLKNKM